MANSQQQILELLTPIFQDVFDNDALVITSNTKAEDVDGWDSLAHIRLIVSIEKALNIRFSAAEISGLEKVGDLVALILRKQAG